MNKVQMRKDYPKQPEPVEKPDKLDSFVFWIAVGLLAVPAIVGIICLVGLNVYSSLFTVVFVALIVFVIYKLR